MRPSKSSSRFTRFARWTARENARRGEQDTGTPDLDLDEGGVFEAGKRRKAGVGSGAEGKGRE